MSETEFLRGAWGLQTSIVIILRDEDLTNDDQNKYFVYELDQAQTRPLCIITDFNG